MNKLVFIVTALLLALGVWIAVARLFAELVSSEQQEEAAADNVNEADDHLLDAIDSKKNMIHVVYPEPYEMLESSLSISGRARGTWYFEASFPVRLVDENGDLIASGIATA